MSMLEHALQYVGRGWPIFQVNGYKLPFKGSHGHLDASTDAAAIRELWRKRPRANIALACGELAVVDVDGPQALARLQAIAAELGGLPETLTAQTSRGVHLFFRCPAGMTIRTRNEPRAVKGGDGIDIKGAGGYVVLPPSINVKTGFAYRWLIEVPPAEFPLPLLQKLGASNTVQAPANAGLFGQKPSYLDNSHEQTGLNARASIQNPWSAEEEARIREALAAIPATGYDTWRTVGMALHALDWHRSDGTSAAFDLFDEWSATSPEEYSPEATEKKWLSFGKRQGITIGSLFHLAQQHGWEGLAPVEYQEVMPHSEGSDQSVLRTAGNLSALHNPQPLPDNPLFAAPAGAVDFKVNPPGVNGHSHSNGHVSGPGLLPGAFTARSGSPLIELNQKYAVIGDVGGKCMVMAWVPSSADPTIEIPSFQTFKTFQERHSHRYVAAKPKLKVLEEADAGTEPEQVEWVQLGTAWLKWPKRRSFERLDLVPGGEHILPNGALNLWRGFGVIPKAGSWERMKAHIAEVLADGDVEALNYIVKWAAWSVQHPDKQAGAALVFRGDEGTGKGVFARTMCQIFGQHGVQLYNSKHMVGFNALLRNCLLLYADEAFWAGDKQGESTLKGLITEPSIVIEGKGVNAEMWKNRLHVIMTSNADWVVPAGHSSRRYAVFDTNNTRKQDRAYFDPLYEELNNGGREAMLHDLLAVDLGNWQPHQIVKNKALEEQKARSLDPLADWYLNLLSEARLPPTTGDNKTVSSGVLINNAQLYSRQLGNTLTSTKLGLFLRQVGCIKRTNVGKPGNNGWAFPPLSEARARWESRFGSWSWGDEATEWGVRP